MGLGDFRAHYRDSGSGSRPEAFKYRFNRARFPPRLEPGQPLSYGAGMAAAQDPRRLLDQPLPDLELHDANGGTYRLRARAGTGPLVVFFIIHAATPG